jgi:hypothetical protein
MEQLLFVFSESAEGFAAAAIGHSIFTQADTMEELEKMVRSAVICHFVEGKRPKSVRLVREISIFTI